MTTVLFVNCNSSGGKNLVAGDNYGKTYSIGDNAMSENYRCYQRHIACKIQTS